MKTLTQIANMVRAGRVSQAIVEAVVSGDTDLLNTHAVLKHAVSVSSVEIVMEALKMRSTVKVAAVTSYISALDYLESRTAELSVAAREQSDQDFSDANAEYARLATMANLKIIDRSSVVITGVEICNSLGNGILQGMLMTVLKEKVQYWDKVSKADVQLKRRHGTIIRDAIIAEMGAGSILVSKLGEAYKTIKNFPEDSLVDLNGQVVGIQLTPRGVNLSILDNTNIKVKNGRDFRFKKTISVAVKAAEFNADLLSVLTRVNIHDQVEINESNTFKHAPLMFGKNVLAKLVLLKKNKIDLTSLYSDVNKTMVLSRTDTDALYPIAVPGYAFPSRYLETLSLSLNDAKRGVVAPLATIPRLIQVEADSTDTSIVSRENINKVLSRIDKLENKSGWLTKTSRLFIIDDATHPELFSWLGTGPIYRPDECLVKEGVNRVITSMDNGGIKAVTARLSDLDPRLEAEGISVIAASSLKGGKLSAIGMKVGSYNFLKEGLMNVINNQAGYEFITLLDKVYQESLVERTIRGVVVKGIEVDVELLITNAYTAENYELNEEVSEDLKDELEILREKIMLVANSLEGNIEMGLRDYLMNSVVEDEDFYLGNWINDNLEAGFIRPKKGVTRIIPSEIQSVARWNGKNVAQNWLDSLANNDLNKKSVSKYYAANIITGTCAENVIGRVKAVDLVETLVEGLNLAKHQLNHDSDSYPTELLRNITKNFGTVKSVGWVEVEYPCGTVVYVPTGRCFFNDFKVDSLAQTTVAKGLLKELLFNLKSMLINKEIWHKDLSKSPSLMEATIQVKFFGKEFGYQHTTGFYGVMLPLPILARGDELAVTRRSRYSSSKKEAIRVNSRKHPSLFEGSVAGFSCYGDDYFTTMDEILKDVFACVVFTHPDTILILQDDADGDQRSVTFNEYALPLFVGPAKSVYKKFFNDFVEAEQKGCVVSMKASQRYTLAQMQEEVYKAVTAKEAVGQYTAVKYFYECLISNVSSFTAVNEVVYDLNESDKNKIIDLLNILIQMEAMDNIKQKGSVEFISTLISNYALKDTDKTPLAITIAKLDKIIELVGTLLESLHVPNARELAITFAMTLHYIANNFAIEGMVAFNLMNNNRVMKDNFADIMSDDSTGVFNFFDSYDTIVDGVDQESMYRQIVLTTVKVQLNK